MNVQDLKSQLDLANAIFKRGHDDGYRLGYREGFAEAMRRAKELVDKMFGAEHPPEPK